MSQQPRVAFGRTNPGAKDSKQEAAPLPSSNTAIPYRLQGDPSFSSPENRQKRNDLRKSPLVRRVINKLWMLLPKNERGQMNKESYFEMYIRLCKILNHDFDLEQAKQVKLYSSPFLPSHLSHLCRSLNLIGSVIVMELM